MNMQPYPHPSPRQFRSHFGKRRARSIARVLRALLLVGLLGCEEEGSDDTGGPTQAATDLDLATLCQAECDLSQRCPDSDTTSVESATCQSNCARKLGSGSVYRSVVIEALTHCYQTLDCDTSDDTCTAEAALAVDPTPSDNPSVVACLARHEACDSGTEGGFSDDLCAFPLLLVPSAAKAVDACVQGPCADVRACTNQILGRS